jgi:hypothetical protein
VTASQTHAPDVKLPRHPAPEEFAKFANIAKFANFEGFNTFTGWHEGHAEALHPFRFVGRRFLLHSGQDDAVRGARAANGMPGGEELSRDLRSHEPEPLTGVRDLSRL